MNSDLKYLYQTALIDEGAEIGEDTKIWHWTHICGGARIGSSCSIDQNVFIGNKALIGDNVKIQNNVSVYDNVIIGRCFLCPSMVFTNVLNPEQRSLENKNIG